MSRHPARLRLAIAGGVLMALAFPLGPPLPGLDTDGWWPAAWICLAPIMVAAARARRARGAVLLGLTSGLIAFGAILCWMPPLLVRWAGLTSLEAGAVSAVLILYVSLYVAAFSVCVRALHRRWGGGAFLLAPAVWAGLELARGRLLTGFPWCLLGSSQQPAPLALQVADVAGVYGVSFVLTCASALVAWLADRAPGPPRAAGAPRPGWAVPAALAGIVVIALGYGAVRLRLLPVRGDAVRAALVQANVAQIDKWEPDERERIEADHVAMTKEAAGRGARLVVWSESSVPISITNHPEYVRRLETLADETGADLLVGTVTYEPRNGRMAPFNSAVMVRPGAGLTGRYDKIHLVPFGEYVPLKDFLFFLAPLVHEAGDFEPGDGIRLLDSGASGLGVLICYEAIFPEIARACVRAGASLLVNMTNDAWYGGTAMPRQHLMQAALRAVESRRWLLRCANTGISAVIDPAGRIVARAPYDRRETLLAAAVPARGETVYAASGDAFGIGCAILSLAALAATRIAKPRRQSPGRS